MELNGIDRITMPPGIIEKLALMEEDIKSKLGELTVEEGNKINKIDVSEKNFRWLLNEDEIGNEKLCDGIRIFTKGNCLNLNQSLQIIFYC